MIGLAIITALVIVFLLLSLFLLLSHGKIRIKPIVYQITYCSMVALPLMTFTYYKYLYDLTQYIPYVILYFICILTPTLGYMWYNILKRRQPVFHTFLLSVGILMIISSVFFDTQLVLYLIAAGFALIIPFFVHIFRYPYLDSTWLYSIAEEIAANITNKGKHSLKPVIIDTVSNRKCIINTVGIILYYKNNKVVGIMNRKTHRALGSPNLHEFFISLVETIRKTRTMQ